MRVSKFNWKVVKDNWAVYVLLAPMVIWLVVFAYKPMVGLIMAFQDFSPFMGITGSEFVGFDNFINLMTGAGSDLFWRAVRNTFILSGYLLLFSVPAPIILAIMFNELKSIKFRSLSQSILLVPSFLSEVIIAGVVIAFLQPTSGVVNHLLINLGLIDEGIYFLTRSQYFRGIYVFIEVWRNTGFTALIYFAALTTVPASLYEAAHLDGATRLQRIWHVSIPGILPTIVVMFIMQIGQILNIGFERVLLLYQPATYETADILATFIYRLGLLNADFSNAAAAGLLNSFVALIMVGLANIISKRLSESSLW